MYKGLFILTLLLLIISVYTTVFPKDAYAYIDPGSGSYLTQIILGFVFGGLFMVKLYWKKVKNAIFKKHTSNKKEENFKEE